LEKKINEVLFLESRKRKRMCMKDNKAKREFSCE